MQPRREICQHRREILAEKRNFACGNETFASEKDRETCAAYERNVQHRRQMCSTREKSARVGEKS